ncbi:MAG: sodium:solute symporter, partial [Planctomycetes bacterium]|nr:sodium:solute symporter [Planctomycetota bacterium]
LGLAVFLMDWFKAQTGWNIPFMMSAFYLFVICSAILVSISLVRPHQHTEKSIKLVWNSPLEALRGPAWKGLGNYKVLAVCLFVIMVVLYIIFR